MTKTITVKAEIKRFDPSCEDAPHYETFDVSGPDNMRVLDVIRSIYENQEGNLAYQFACRIGRCGTCGVKVNGVSVLACQEQCKAHMRIEPLEPFKVLRDLVIDRAEVDGFYAELALVPRRKELHRCEVEPINPDLALDICTLNSCLACMVCVSSCPAVHERPFAGPGFMLKLRQLDIHPADTSEHRLEQAIGHGMLECFGCDLCTQLCPADLSPADAIRAFRKILMIGSHRR
jgi:succinate dehydrogenase/fumarate reductase iron-sulfur protein